MNVIKEEVDVKVNVNNKYDKKWYLVEWCDEKIIHDIYNYEQFSSDYDNNNLNFYNISFKKYQEYM